MSHWRSPHADLDAHPALLHEEVLGAAARYADRVAVVDGVTERATTYGELVDRALSAGGGLRAAGARPGEVLSVIAANGPDYPVVVFGALLAGLPVAPASPLLTARRACRVLLPDARPVCRGRCRVAAEGERGRGRRQAVFAFESLPSGEPLAHRGRRSAGDRLPLELERNDGAAQEHDAEPRRARGDAAPARGRRAARARAATTRWRGSCRSPHTFGSALLQHALRAGAKVVTLPRFELEAVPAPHRATPRNGGVRRAADRPRARARSPR